MIYKVSELSKRFRTLVGDGSMDIPEDFIIAGINWGFAQLPMVPKLDRIFTKHETVNLDAKSHYKWELSGDFRRIADVIMINFYTSTGGEPCKLDICFQDTVDFYNENGVPELKEAGVPCHYTLEQDGDSVFLVLDRPSDVPIIVDYIMSGFPKPVEKSTDEVELSAIAENLIFSAMRTVFYEEADDFAFAGQIMDYLDNKQIPEAIQILNKRWGAMPNAVLGEL